MIRDIYIAALGPDQEYYTEPPPRELGLAVIGDNVHLEIVPRDGAGRGEPTASIQVPAKSLAAALQAAIADNDAGA